MTKLFRSAIIGAPGSGKGTLSTKIIQKFDIYHVSTGDIFRRAIEVGDPAGKTVKKYIAEGKLVPDVVVTKVAMKKLKEIADRNWLLDGFPRTTVQAEKLFASYPLDLVISLKVPFDAIIERVKNRWIHLPSGRIYNTIYKPPKVWGKDDVTGEPLIQRPDDNPEALLQRLEVYLDYVTPLLEFYRKQKILKEVSGESSDQLWPIIEKELMRFIKPKAPSF